MSTHLSTAGDSALPTTAGWETFAHGADVGVRGRGPTLADAFVQAAIALTSVITDPACVRPERRIEVTCEAPDREVLFLDWLNSLISAMAIENMLFSRFGVEIEGNRLKGHAFGEAIDPTRHRPTVEVKGATFTELQVTKDKGGRWRAQCVVDV
ncbi:MAG TPA: archease [Phenylobacterium sp.]|nr:archease [Phenylobacterium sp.]